MGEWYEFEIQLIDGVEKPVFCYANSNTGFNEVIVELSKSQVEVAREWQKRHNALLDEKNNIIKGFLGI